MLCDETEWFDDDEDDEDLFVCHVGVSKRLILIK